MLASVMCVFSYVIYLNCFMAQNKNDVIYCCTMGDVIYTFCYLFFIYHLS